MSSLPISSMITQLQQRVPMNLSRDYCLLKLNQAYEWIEQQGSFSWDVRITLVTVQPQQYWVDLVGNSSTGPETPATVNLNTVDIGKPIDIFQAPAGGFKVTIPFVPPDRIGLYQIFNTTPIPGIFAAWTLRWNQVLSCYQILFAPSSAALLSVALGGVPINYALQYHQIGTGIGFDGLGYFPTPDQFNTLLLELAEGEIKRNYSIVGADMVLQKAQASTILLADMYRSSKLHQVGMGEEVKDAQETQASAAGN